MIVINHEIAQIQEIDIHGIDPLALDQRQFYHRVEVFALCIVIEIENFSLIELHHVPDTMKIMNN